MQSLPLDLESVQHMFGNYIFFQNVWDVISSQLGFKVRWDKQTLEENATNFLNKLGMQMDVILATFWSVWSVHNLCLFQDVNSNYIRTGMKSLCWLHSYGALKMKISSQNIRYPLEEQQGAIGFF